MAVLWIIKKITMDFLDPTISDHTNAFSFSYLIQ